MPNNYSLTAKVDQIVTKEVQLLITAASEEEAQQKARTVLSEYPKPVTEEGVTSILTTKSTYWIPKSIDFTKIKKIAKG